MTEVDQDESHPLRGTVIRYIDPLSPVAEGGWEVLQPDACPDRGPGDPRAGGRVDSSLVPRLE